MPSLFTETEARARSRQAADADRVSRKTYSTRSAREILQETTASFSESKTYNIFLSHSVRDAELILGIKGMLEDLGYSVYVDWIDDPQLDRTQVSPRTADILRKRMIHSRSLFYVTTENAQHSKWMPWECGYFDGIREKVAILPVTKTATSSYSGQEYLGLYPFCQKGQNIQHVERLWIYKDQKTYLPYDDWVSRSNKEVEWNKLSY